MNTWVNHQLAEKNPLRDASVIRDGDHCWSRQAPCPGEQGSAATPTAREGVKLWGNRALYPTRLCVFAIFVRFTLHVLDLRARSHTWSVAAQTRVRVVGEAGSHRGGAHVGRVETDRAARSVGGSHPVRIPTSTTTGADRRWP